MPKKVAVVLAGCGFKDGAEIRESVLALWALSMEGAEVEIFAPNKDLDEVDHLTFEPTGKKRPLLNEAARIARGKITTLEKADSKNFDAIILPGGFGLAKNLCTFAAEGPNCKVEPSLEKFLDGFIREQKPIGAICIAPALVAKVFQKHGGVKVTLGDSPDAEKAVETMGAKILKTKANEIATDSDRKVVSTPAYMYDSASLKDISEGIHKLTKQILSMCR